MNQTGANCKKPNSGPDFGQSGPKTFFIVGFTSTRCYTLLQAIIVFSLKENVESKLKKMANSHFGLDLDLLDPNSSHHFFHKTIS